MGKHESFRKQLWYTIYSEAYEFREKYTEPTRFTS